MFSLVRLRLPCLIYNTAAVFLPLLQKYLVLPILDIAGVHESTRLNAKSTPRATRRHALDGGYVDVLAGVVLERGLRAVDLEVDLGLGVVRLDEGDERLAARVDGHGVGRCAGVDHEAVVDIGLLGA